MPHRPKDDWTRPMPRTPGGADSNDTPLQAPPQEWVTDQERWQSSRHPTSADTQQFDPRTGQQRTGQQWSGGWDNPPRSPDRSDRAARRPRYRKRRFTLFVLLVVGAYVAAMVGAVAASWLAITEVDATPTNDARPASAAGSNVVLVGTDSRADLTSEQRNELNAGDVEGARADTIMVLHLPNSGDPTLVSLPRDSYVDIPGEGMNKINAAYSIGGPPLLVDSVEQSTGLRVDGYLEIGFDGFVDVVAAVGGVQMCLPEAVFEERSDLDLAAGCQELAGNTALSYVRMRYADPRGDLGRVERQREFLSGLVNEMTAPSTLFVPWELYDAGTATGSSLSRGDDTSMWEMARIGLAMRSISRGSGESLTVPVADANFSTPAGSSVLWDEAAAIELFDALRTDTQLTIDP